MEESPETCARWWGSRCASRSRWTVGGPGVGGRYVYYGDVNGDVSDGR